MRLLSCHTSGCDDAPKELSGAELPSPPAGPDPFVAAHWPSLTVEMQRTTPGSTSDLGGDPAGPLGTPFHRTGTRGYPRRAGPTSGPEGCWREGGAAPVWPNPEYEGGTASRTAQSREAGFPPDVSASYQYVRWIAIACARSLTDIFSGPIEGSSRFLFSPEKYCAWPIDLLPQK